jgi:hypothetical protein
MKNILRNNKPIVLLSILLIVETVILCSVLLADPRFSFLHPKAGQTNIIGTTVTFGEIDEDQAISIAMLSFEEYLSE